MGSARSARLDVSAEKTYCLPTFSLLIMPPTMGDETERNPGCPRCRNPIRLDRVSMQSYGYPEVRTYLCEYCEESIQVAVLDDHPEC
jgi:hypothetical protein